ncbi:Phospholipase/carboxylesterase/thioesterase [Amanita muscaria]
MAPIAKALKYLTVLLSINTLRPSFSPMPQKQITANMGMSMPAWFDIYSFNFDKETKEDEKGMLSSVQSLNDLISAEVEASIEPDRIVIGGFSQGGALSLLTGLTSGRKLAGVVVLSGWLPIHKSSNRTSQMLSEHTSSTPIFWGHGTKDPLVTHRMGKDSEAYLLANCGVQTD